MSNQQLQKIYIGEGKVCCIKVFRANLGKFGQNILCIPKFPTPTSMIPSCWIEYQIDSGLNPLS